jgi:hypothetical protein
MPIAPPSRPYAHRAMCVHMLRLACNRRCALAHHQPHELVRDDEEYYQTLAVASILPACTDHLGGRQPVLAVRVKVNPISREPSSVATAALPAG